MFSATLYQPVLNFALIQYYKTITEKPSGFKPIPWSRTPSIPITGIRTESIDNDKNGW